MLIDSLRQSYAGRLHTDATAMAPVLTDWRREWTGHALAVAQPDSTADVAAVVRWCREQREAWRLFPLSLAVQGTCTIGGNLATNAGRVQVLRDGNACELCLGLEVVTPDGEVWNGLRALRKDNTGYDLRDLFVGSEGTLGVITAAVLKLHPLPGAQKVAVVSVQDPQAALGLLTHAQSRLGACLTAFEAARYKGPGRGPPHAQRQGSATPSTS